MDGGGNVLIADWFNQRIRRLAAGTGVITTVAGNGVSGFSGDGGPATSARLMSPQGVAVDGSGNVLIADTSNNCIRRVATGTGIITTIAGTGAEGFNGDGVPATSAMLREPRNLVFDNKNGRLLIADYLNHRIRILSAPTQPSPSATPSPSPTPYCQSSLFRPLPRTDLVGSLVGTALTPGEPVALPSEAACRQACCDAAACDGYSFDASYGMFNPLAHCYLFVNVSQLVPSNNMVSSIRESALL